jgi:hypothetical protein
MIETSGLLSIQKYLSFLFYNIISIETAKANGLTQFEPMVYLLEQTAAQNTNVEQLLPWRFNKD